MQSDVVVVAGKAGKSG